MVFDALRWLRLEYIEDTVVRLVLVLLFDLVGHAVHGLILRVTLRTAFHCIQFLLDLLVPAPHHWQCPQREVIDYTHSLSSSIGEPGVDGDPDAILVVGSDAKET